MTIETVVGETESPAQPAITEPIAPPAEPADTRSPFEKHLEKASAKVAKEGKVATPKEPPAKTEIVADPLAAKAPASPGTEPPAFTPNFKFKVMDKEHEIPEQFRQAIKDATTEKQVREIFEKAYGLDYVKPKLEQERTEKAQVIDQYNRLAQGIEEVKGYYQKGDLDGFFKRLNVPFEQLLQYVADKINYSKLPPEQRQVMESRRAAEERAESLEREQAQGQQQSNQMLAQAVQHGLNLALDRPDVKAAAESYDARVGKPGAFKEEVVSRGEFYWLRGQLIPPDQAVGEVMRLLGPVPAPTVTPTAAAPAPAATTPPAKTVPVIPNVQGKSTSPLPQKPRSIADLKKLAAEM